MKAIKKLFVTILIVGLVIISTIQSYATDIPSPPREQQDLFFQKLLKTKGNDFEEQVKVLKIQKILIGTEKGLELDKPLTRAEGSVIYTRIFGLEHKIAEFVNKDKTYNSGFNDLPNWAKPEIEYLHKTGIISGINNTTFGSNNYMTAEQFMTLILRGLGYDDSKSEFIWSKSLDKAVEIGIITEDEKQSIKKDEGFIREEMATLAYNSLFAQNKNTGNTVLAEKVFRVVNEAGILNNFGVELIDEEIVEIEKTIDYEYVVFNDNKEKQTILYNKIEGLSEKILGMVDIEVEGKSYQIENILKVNRIYMNEQGYITIIFDISNNKLVEISLIIDDNILRPDSDINIMWTLGSSVAKDIFIDMNKLKPNAPIMTNTSGIDRTTSKIILNYSDCNTMEFKLYEEPTILKVNLVRVK